MILQAGRRIRGIVAAGARCDNSTMKPPRWSLRTMFLTIAILGVALVVFVSPALKQPSNCGGNSEALNDVKLYALTLQWAAEARSDHQFDIASATLGQLKELRDLASGPAGARYLVSPQPYRHPPTGQKRIVIVCDRTFTNVPRRLVGRAPSVRAPPQVVVPRRFLSRRDHRDYAAGVRGTGLQATIKSRWQLGGPERRQAVCADHAMDGRNKARPSI
jgi:hypothetical protein